MNKSALIIFIKNPELGKAKTRLAKTVGDKQALRIYRALLTHTRQQCLAVDCTRYLYYSRFIDHEDEWSPSAFQKCLQGKGDLGDRMNQAFAEVLSKYQRAIIIGSDCASLTSHIISQAIAALSKFDFVIGPAKDGGYYLLGMNAPEKPAVFNDIEWSTKQVLSTTISRIENLDASYELLPELSDIDTQEDWENYGWQI